jgi:hypothetical protein
VAKIIISYRRSDSDVFAGRIRDRIANTFGEDSVFIDVDNIPLGKDFRLHIQEEMSAADAVLVVIGPKWLGLNESGPSRILEDTDPVRIEVETALRNRLPIIPILFGKTPMPQPEQLPASLKDFAFINAASVDTGRDFHRDLSRVVDTISKFLEAKEGAARRPRYGPQIASGAEPARGLRVALWAMSFAIAAIIVAVAGVVYWLKEDLISQSHMANPEPQRDSSHVSDVAPSPTPKPASPPAPISAPIPPPATAPAITIKKSAAFGGSGGAAFDDTDSNTDRAQVSAISVIINPNPGDGSQLVLGGFRVQWGDRSGAAHGGKGPLPQPVASAQFAPDEKIGRVDVNWRSYHFPNVNPPPQWISGLAIWTDVRVYKFGDMSFGPVSQCVLDYGERLLGFFGRSGSYIDQIGCIIGKPK